MIYFARFILFVSAGAMSKMATADDRPRALRIKNADKSASFASGQHAPLNGGNTVAEGVSDEVAAIAEAFRALAVTSDPVMSLSPSAAPTASFAPTLSGAPSIDSFVNTTESPSIAPSVPATAGPGPSDVPSSSPSVAPTIPAPVTLTAAPVANNITIDSSAPTSSPVNQTCIGITEEERIQQIFALLDEVANPDDIRDLSTPQGKATAWIIEQDTFYACPDNTSCQFIQRWSLAVIYFSTNGDDWFECSANPNASDPCGTVRPFRGQERFLSSGTECNWAGITCNIQGCVTEIVYEENNLVGTIATEIGLLRELVVWGMERGSLVSTIPTEVGQLTNLIFIDLDFNELTGTLTSELLSLSSLTQLDLNDNKMTGSINGIGVFPDMEFLQLHNNNFSGTVPEAVGTYSDMTAFTLHGTSITGTMPESICSLRAPSGVLTSLIADCKPGVGGVAPDIFCDCCSDCRNEKPATRP